MRKTTSVLLMVSAVILSGCINFEPEVCKVDTNCQGERICQAGECVYPTCNSDYDCRTDAFCQRGTCVSDLSGGLTCGEAIDECNCAYLPASIPMQEEIGSHMCESNTATYNYCEGCCVYDVHGYCVGFPWELTCGCEG